MGEGTVFSLFISSQPERDTYLPADGAGVEYLPSFTWDRTRVVAARDANVTTTPLRLN